MQNYDPSKLRDVSVPLTVIASKALMPSIVLTIAPLLPHVAIWGVRVGFNARDYLLGFVAFVVLIVAHEAVHALGWILFAGVAPKDIRFGIAWKTLSPYAHSMVAMPARGYRVGVVLPLIVTGIFTGGHWHGDESRLVDGSRSHFGFGRGGRFDGAVGDSGDSGLGAGDRPSRKRRMLCGRGVKSKQ